MTVLLEVLQSSTEYFKRRGVENPRLIAEHYSRFILGRKGPSFSASSSGV